MSTFKRILLFIVPVVALVVCSVSTYALAWDVTIRNPTDRALSVNVYRSLWIGAVKGENKAIYGRATVTFDTGSYCPCSMSGNIRTKQSDTVVEANLQTATCAGNDAVDVIHCGACCVNSSWYICRKRGSGDKINDNDYGFCKE